MKKITVIFLLGSLFLNMMGAISKEDLLKIVQQGTIEKAEKALRVKKTVIKKDLELREVSAGLKDAYRILGVTATATKDEVSNSFRKLSLQYHPDRANREDTKAVEEANKIFKLINSAKDLILKSLEVKAAKNGEKTEEEEDIFDNTDLSTVDFGRKIEILPTQITLPKEAKLIFTIPGLGSVEFKPMLGTGGVVEGFQSQYPPKLLDWGVLKIEKGLFQIAGGKISYNAFISMMGKRAKAGLKDFSLALKEGETAEDLAKASKPIQVYKMTLGVEFLEGALTLEMIPGKKIEVKQFDLILEEKKGAIIRLTTDAFGQVITAEGELDIQKKELTLKGVLKARSLTDIIPNLKATVLNGLYTDGLFILKFIARPLTDEEKRRGMLQQAFTIRGTLKRSAADATKNIDILGVTLQEATVFIDTYKQHAFIAGKSTIQKLLLQSYFAVFYGEAKGVKFSAEVAQNVKEWRPFEDVPVQGLKDVVVTDLKGGVKAQYSAAAAGKKDQLALITEEEAKKSKTAESLAAAAAEEPAADAKIVFGSEGEWESAKQGVENFERFFRGVEDLKLEGDKGAQIEFYLSGKSKLLNIESEVIVKIDKASQKNFGITLIGQLVNFKLSRVFPDAFKPVPGAPEIQAQGRQIILDAVDLFELKYARVAVSSRKDMIAGEAIEPGFNLMAEATLDAPSDNKVVIALKDVISKAAGPAAEGKPASLKLVGNFNPTDPKNVVFKIALGAGSLGFNLGQTRFDGGNLYLVIKGEPAVGFGGGFKMVPAPGEQELQFDLQFTATPIGFVGAGSMKNIWKDPFGVKGFEFGNLGLRGSQTWTAIAEAAASAGAALFVPATLGLSGDVRVGHGTCEGGKASDDRTFCAKLRFNVGKDIKELAVVLDVDNPPTIITFLRILLEQLKAPVNLLQAVDKLAPVQISKAKIYFVPVGTNIGTINVEQGLGTALYLNLFGLRDAAFVDNMLSIKEVMGKGKIRAFELGPIKFTNYDQTCDTATGTFKTPPALPVANADDLIGQARQEPKKVCGPEMDLTLSLEKEPRFVIDGLMKLGDVFQSKTKWFITKDGIGFDTKSFIGPEKDALSIRLTGTSIPFNDLEAIAKLTAKDLFLEIEFQDNLRERINKDILHFAGEKKKDFEKVLNDVIEGVVRTATEEDIRRQEAVLKKAQAGRVWCKDNLLECLEKERIVTAEAIQLGALQVKYKIDESDVGKLFRDVMDKLGITKLMEISLRGIKEVGVGAFDQGRFAFSDLSHLAIVKRVYWKGDANDLADLKIPGVQVDFSIAGKPITRKLGNFDLKDPLGSIHAIAQNIVNLAVDSIKLALNIPLEVVVKEFPPLSAPRPTLEAPIEQPKAPPALKAPRPSL